MKKLFLYIIVSLAPFLSKCDILLWSVTEDTPVYEHEVEENYFGTIREYLLSHQAEIPWDGYWNFLAARVAVKDSNNNLLRYMEDRIGQKDYDAFSKSFYAGYPKSEATPDAPGFGVANAKTEELNSLGDDFWYQVEIIAGARNRWDPNTVIYSTVLYSDNISGLWLDDMGHYNPEAEQGDVTGLNPWIPERFYTQNPSITPYNPPVIPEPSASILVVLGLGGLLLRRRSFV